MPNNCQPPPSPELSFQVLPRSGVMQLMAVGLVQPTPEDSATHSATANATQPHGVGSRKLNRKPCSSSPGASVCGAP